MRVAAVELSDRPGPPLRDRPPDGRHLGPVGIAVPQENSQFAGREGNAGPRGRGPPVEAALGEAFSTEPKPLAIIRQEFERGPGAVAKDVDRAAQRVLCQCLATQRGEAINAFAKVDGLEREKDATLRGEGEQ